MFDSDFEIINIPDYDLIKQTGQVSTKINRKLKSTWCQYFRKKYRTIVILSVSISIYFYYTYRYKYKTKLIDKIVNKQLVTV